mgnify:FL=1
MMFTSKTNHTLDCHIKVEFIFAAIDKIAVLHYELRMFYFFKSFACNVRRREMISEIRLFSIP